MTGDPTVSRLHPCSLDRHRFGRRGRAARRARPTAIEGSNTLGNIARQVPLDVPGVALDGARCRRRHRRRPAGADRRVRAHGRSVARQGLGHRALGNRRPGSRSPLSDVSAGVSAGHDARVRAPHRPGDDRQRRRRRARRSSTSWDQSTCAPARSSSTRRPTACFRSPRTRTWCRSTTQYDMCRVAFEMFAIGLGVGRVIARPFVGTPGQFQRTANRRDFALTPPVPTLLDRLSARRS